MKLTEEDKINIYESRKSGVTIADLSRQFGILKSGISYLVNLIDIHGYSIVKREYRKHDQAFKQDSIDRVLIKGESLNSVALECGLSSAGMLHNWIRIYKEDGYNILDKKRGPITMKKNKIMSDKVDTEESKVKQLEKEIEYLKAENAFLKKWNAVVQQEEKHKKRK